jgi:hypothetical protein
VIFCYIADSRTSGFARDLNKSINALFTIFARQNVHFMLVLPLEKIEPSESIVALTSVSPMQQVPKDTQSNKLLTPLKSFDSSAAQVLQQIDQRDKNLALRKAWLKKQQELQAQTRDSLYNIYTGNPGLYSTEGDTIGFGNVPYLSDSLFHENMQSIAEKPGKPYGLDGKNIDYPKQDWLLGLLLIAWVIFASVRVGFSKYLNQLIASLVNVGVATRLYRERGYKTFYGAILLNFLFYILLPLSVFQIVHFYNVDLPGYPDLVLFLILMLAISGYFFLKLFLCRIIGSIILLKEEIAESNYHMQMYYKVLGVFLLPIVTVHAVSNEIRYFTVLIMTVLIVMFYLASIVRSIYIGNRKGISNFYLILYLCMLEILPLILIFKILTKE